MFRAAPPLDEVFVGDFDGDDDDDGFIVEQVGSWDRRLTRREKATRLALSVGVVAVVAVVLLGGPGALLALLQRWQPAWAAPAAQAAAEAPMHVVRTVVPVGTWQNPFVRVVPANGPANLAYVCWVDEPRRYMGLRVAPLRLQVFTPEDEVWQVVRPPVAEGAWCDLATDLTAQDRALLVVGHVQGEGSGRCALPDLYLTEDRGATWRRVPWPTGGQACNAQVTLDGERIYARTDAPLLAAEAAPGDAAGRLFVSRDVGRTWQAADRGLAQVQDFAVVAFRPGGWLLAQGIAPEHPWVTTLWESRDGGAQWQQAGTAPGRAVQVFASSDPHLIGNGGWGKLYARVAPGGRTPGATGKPFLVEGTLRGGWSPTPLDADGSPRGPWSRLDPPPDMGNALAVPMGTLLDEAAEGPAGMLLYTRPELSPSATGGVLRFRLLMWDGQRWRVSTYRLPANTGLQGVSWYEGQMRVWLTYAQGSIAREAQVMTFTLTADR